MILPTRSSLEYESRHDFRARRRAAIARSLVGMTPARRIAMEFTLWMIGLFAAGFVFAGIISLLKLPFGY